MEGPWRRPTRSAERTRFLPNRRIIRVRGPLTGSIASSGYWIQFRASTPSTTLRLDKAGLTFENIIYAFTPPL